MLKDATDFESVKVIDFGFSTECDVKSYLYPKCGTPGYVAPEIINLQDLTKKYSNKCDLFSCGVILYKLYQSFFHIKVHSLKFVPRYKHRGYS